MLGNRSTEYFELYTEDQKMDSVTGSQSSWVN